MSTTLDLLSRHLAIPGAGMEERALRLILELGTELVGAEEGSLFVVDEEAQELVLTMTVGSTTSEEALRGQRMPLGTGITGLAVLSREVQMGSTKYSDIKQSKERDPDQTGLDPTAVVAAPLLAGEKVVGAITGVSFLPERRFTAKDAERYARFASIAGVVIDQRRRLQLVAGNQGDEQELVEQRIINRLTRIIDRNPHSLEAIANLLDAVDAMMSLESVLP